MVARMEVVKIEDKKGVEILRMKAVDGRDAGKDTPADDGKAVGSLSIAVTNPGLVGVVAVGDLFDVDFKQVEED
jgi:hypothetical protein